MPIANSSSDWADTYRQFLAKVSGERCRSRVDADPLLASSARCSSWSRRARAQRRHRRRRRSPHRQCRGTGHARPPRHALQGIVQHLRLVDAAERAVEEKVAAVGEDRRAVLAEAQLDLALAAGLGGIAPQPCCGSRPTRSAPPRREADRPRASPRFEASAMTIMRSDDIATIFSCNSAPPPPLMSRSSSSSSSAPSTVRSRNGTSSSVVRGMPSRSACARVASEVGTPRDA